MDGPKIVFVVLVVAGLMAVVVGCFLHAEASAGDPIESLQAQAVTEWVIGAGIGLSLFAVLGLAICEAAEFVARAIAEQTEKLREEIVARAEDAAAARHAEHCELLGKVRHRGSAAAEHGKPPQQPARPAGLR